MSLGSATGEAMPAWRHGRAEQKSSSSPSKSVWSRVDILPSGRGGVSLYLLCRGSALTHSIQKMKTQTKSSCLPPLCPTVLWSQGLTSRNFFSSTYLLHAPDVTSDPFQYQIQLWSVPYLVVSKLDLPFAGPTYWRSRISHPGCLARRKGEVLYGESIRCIVRMGLAEQKGSSVPATCGHLHRMDWNRLRLSEVPTLFN